MSGDAWAGAKVGETLKGLYRLGGVLGVGGMGAVYEATHLKLNKPVAVKLMAPELAREKQFLARFRREAQAIAAFDNPNVVKVYDYAIDPMQGAFIVMELLEGESLATRLGRRGRFEPRDAIRVGVELMTALAELHEAGVIHRDLKPANVFLHRVDDAAWRVKLLDFGVAKLHEEAAKTLLTRPGETLGTPRYMAPEQWRGINIDGRVDIYAAGAILYGCVSGVPPYRGLSTGQIASVVHRKAPEPLHTVMPDVPQDLRRVIEMALQRDPEARFPTARAMGRALEACGGSPSKSKSNKTEMDAPNPFDEMPTTQLASASKTGPLETPPRLGAGDHAETMLDLPLAPGAMSGAHQSPSSDSMTPMNTGLEDAAPEPAGGWPLSAKLSVVALGLIVFGLLAALAVSQFGS